MSRCFFFNWSHLAVQNFPLKLCVWLNSLSIVRDHSCCPRPLSLSPPTVAVPALSYGPAHSHGPRPLTTLPLWVPCFRVLLPQLRYLTEMVEYLSF